MAAPFLVPAAISIASEFFPVIATRLGGPRGRKLAEDVVQVAASIAGAPRDADAREIIATLKEDRVKAAELRLRLEALDQAEHERVLDDRADARAHQLAVGRAGRLRGTFMLIGVVLGLIGCIVSVFRGSVDPAALALLTTIAGALLKMLSDAFAFEFGSSAGSKEKTAHIETIQKALIETTRDRGERREAERSAAAAVRAPSEPASLAAHAPDATAPDLPPLHAAPDRADVTLTATAHNVDRRKARDFVAELMALSA